MKESIGGYFSLELNSGEEFHKNAIRLNTGRNCFEYILRSEEYKKVYVPYYICKTILEPLRKLKIKFENYNINKELEPVFRKQLKNKEALLYVNYFGLKQKSVDKLFQKYHNRLIVDNSQAFFANPSRSAITFYSVRKFFGVPDGAYLYTNKKLNIILETDVSFDRMDHLLRRLDLSAEIGYPFFLKNESRLSNQPIKSMSKLTKMLLKSIDYNKIKNSREHNFIYLHKHLRNINEFKIDIDALRAPLAYPLLLSHINMREILIKEKIYVPTYWENVLRQSKKYSFERKLAKYLLPLPIDQRYGIGHMKKIVNLIKKYGK